MIINENYNSAKQKYGIEMVDSLSKLGLPPQYLLSACRFYNENGIPPQRLIVLFKEWMRYVMKYNKNIDVNTLSYEQFYTIISQEKSKHCLPNVIFSNDNASLGKINNAKDVQSIPVRNQWCIKSQRWFDNYNSQGYEFFVIYLPKEPLPFTFTIAAIVNGNVEYFDSNDYEQFENLANPNEINNSDHENYQRKLPQEIVSYLYNIAANQTEQIENKQNLNCNKDMKRTNKIRLTESQLHQVIKESVEKILQEGEGQFSRLYKDKNAPKTYQPSIDALAQRMVDLEESERAIRNEMEEIQKELGNYFNMSWDEFTDYANHKYGLSRDNMDNNWDDFCTSQYNKNRYNDKSY